MNRVRVLDWVGWFEGVAAATLDQGPVEFLRDHAAAGDGATHRCSRDVLARHLEGATLQEAFLSSRMPPILSRLLEEGMVQGVLDHISRQATDVLADAGDELGAHAALSVLLTRYQERPESQVLCTGCQERELGAIVRRARVEGADTVYLEMDGPEVLVQRYLAVKLVEVRVAGHHRTLESLRVALDAGDTVRSDEGEYGVLREGEGDYVLGVGGQAFLRVMVP